MTCNLKHPIAFEFLLRCELSGLVVVGTWFWRDFHVYGLSARCFPRRTKEEKFGQRRGKGTENGKRGYIMRHTQASECAQGENEKVCRASFRVCVLYSTIFTVLCNRTSLVWFSKRKNFATWLNSKEKAINSLRCFFSLWELSHHSSTNSLSQVVVLSRFHLHTSRWEERAESKLEKFHKIA